MVVPRKNKREGECYMKREFLKQLELENETIEKIMSEHGKSVQSLKEEVEPLKEEVENYKQQINERDNQLEELSKNAKGSDELKEQLEELKKQNEQTKQEYEEQLQKQQFDFTLDKKLSNEVKNSKAVKALLDLETIKVDNGDVKGLDEQLNSLKESDPYLFNEQEEETKTKPSVSTGEHKGQASNDEDLSKFRKSLGLK